MKIPAFVTLLSVLALTTIASGRTPSNLLAKFLVTVTNEIPLEVYHNGKPVAALKRQHLVERPGAIVEKVSIWIKPGDWVVFHLKHGDADNAFFAAAGCLTTNEFGFASDLESKGWSFCEDPAEATAFILHRDAGVSEKTNVRTTASNDEWVEAEHDLKTTAGHDFNGLPFPLHAAATWIKFVASKEGSPGKSVVKHHDKAPLPTPPQMPLLTARRRPVQILSAVYGTGGKNADVTAKIKELVETNRQVFAVNPTDLGADPNPYWNKHLHIEYMKDGVHRAQGRNENEWVLPESFYGPQDAAELRSWLPETRWLGAKDEVQFHADRTFTIPGGASDPPQWETSSANQLRLIWSGDRKVEYVFDYTWTSFHEKDHEANVYHLAK